MGKFEGYFFNQNSNKKIRTDLTPEEDLDWQVTLDNCFIAYNKIFNYALKDEGKSKGFKENLGYTKENGFEFIKEISSQLKTLNSNDLQEISSIEQGRRFQSFIYLRGNRPEDKKIKILIGWIKRHKENVLSLTTIHFD